MFFISLRARARYWARLTASAWMYAASYHAIRARPVVSSSQPRTPCLFRQCGELPLPLIASAAAFSLTPGVVSFLIDQVGTLAGQVELDCISFSENWRFAFDGESPALAEGAVGLGLKLLEGHVGDSTLRPGAVLSG